MYFIIYAGDISKCPDHVRKDAIRSHGYLNQYGRYCFVLNPLADTWGNAEQHCKIRGGHLLTIQNAPEQEFFTNYLKSHHYVESVFIGLTDADAEGTYQWISGGSTNVGTIETHLGKLALDRIFQSKTFHPGKPVFE